MKTFAVAVGALAVLSLSWSVALQAAEAKKDPAPKGKPAVPAAKKSGNSQAKDVEVTGRFVRMLDQQEVLGRKYVGLEVQSEDDKAKDNEPLKLLIPNREDPQKGSVADMTRILEIGKLKAGQRLRVTYYAQDEYNWLREYEVLAALKDNKDNDKADDKDKNDHNRNNNRHYNRNNDRHRNNNRRPTPKPPTSTQTTPVAGVPKSTNMNTAGGNMIPTPNKTVNAPKVNPKVTPPKAGTNVNVTKGAAKTVTPQKK